MRIVVDRPPIPEPSNETRSITRTAQSGTPATAFICPQCRAEPAGEFIALALKGVTMRRWLPSLAFALIFAAPAAAADLPARKPGLWELKMAFEGGNLP